MARAKGDAEQRILGHMGEDAGLVADQLAQAAHLGAATGEGAAVDIALTLALLAAFASFAFVKAKSTTPDSDPPKADGDA